MARDRDDGSLAERAAGLIQDASDAYRREFREITQRAPSRQAQCDWRGMQQDAVERLDLYERVVRQTVAGLHLILGEHIQGKPLWAQMKAAHSNLIARRVDFELAETFFNSVTRRIFVTVGVDPEIEYVDSDFEGTPPEGDEPIYTVYAKTGTTRALVRDILADRPLKVAYQDIDHDARLIADEIEARRQAVWGTQPIEKIEVVKPVFYRNKGAYIIGRIRGGNSIMPLVIALVSEDQRVLVDAVLLTKDEASIVFSFARSSFHVDVEGPRELIQFLKSIMPVKRVAELYISLGYNKHGKAELHRNLIHHLERSTDRFEIAPGDRGMVMLVFAMPSYDVVFKVIRDTFAYPKTTTRRNVMEKYELVFKHDRAGRLVDAQEFEHLAFPKERFSPELLAELLAEAAASVTIEGDRVAIKHLYAERRVRPLNLYLREADGVDARDVVLDYGQAIKDLAATNIFPGDLLLKNFGVTRHGRVIFYDYDELCLLTDCNFRDMPRARDLDEELAAEPWFYVGPNDMFPEEFVTFIGLQGDLRDVFLQTHGDLFAKEFWTRMQALHHAGEVVDIFPYRRSRRLRATCSTLQDGRRGV